MGNPDFEKIKESRFETFYHEHFFEFLQTLSWMQDLQQTWEEGIQIRPYSASISCQRTFECFFMVKRS